ncbi:MAG: alpha/beta hydrolase [Candidatus Methylacidiphilales bacterium]|nr:alpha/beta hydrolase [Candidatus Methylacidiphilales bacterium]
MTTYTVSPHTFPLWEGDAPGALGNDPLRDIPTLTAYVPIRANVLDPQKVSAPTKGSAVIICPGGGYGGLAAHEGRDYALWLNERGIAAFVLKYRLGSHEYRHPCMWQDVSRAIRTVRSRAREWSLNPEKIGVMGSSAGGHLSATILTLNDAGNPESPDPVERVSSRPDLGILCYPVINMGSIGHAGSRRNLLGENPSEEMLRLLSGDLQVTSATPPCFLWHTQADTGVVAEHSLLFALALQRAGVRFDLHIYEKGGHGMGLGVKGYDPAITNVASLHPWTRDLEFWLREEDFAD